MYISTDYWDNNEPKNSLIDWDSHLYVVVRLVHDSARLHTDPAITATTTSASYFLPFFLFFHLFRSFSFLS